MNIYSIVTNTIFQANENDKIIHQLTTMRHADILEEVKSILTQKNK